MFAVTTLLLIVLVGLLITRLATAALVATGMAHESARFQARSAFTGAGFTTTEAESVVSHPVRRRVVMILMLAGNAGIATVAVGLLVGFGGAAPAAAGRRITVLVLGLLVIWLFARSAWVDRRLRKVLGRLLNRFSDIPVRDYAELLHVAGDYVIDELAVCEDDWLSGQRLGDLRLRDRGVVVLGIDRAGHYIGSPGFDTRLEAGDMLLVYGQSSIIRDHDARRSGAPGASAQEHRTMEHRFESSAEADHRDHVLRRDDPE